MQTALQRARRLRRSMSTSEHRFWANVRSRQFGNLKFRRQVPIGPFIVDFLCERHHLVVELDGDTHAHQQAYDRFRDEYLNRCGYRVVRFSNRDVRDNLEGVLESIQLLVCR